MNTLRSICRTRWSYNFKAISCFLKSIPVLKEVQQELLEDRIKDPNILSLDIMTIKFDDDNIVLQALRMLERIFQPFYEETLRLEGDNSNYGLITTALNKLRADIENSEIFGLLQSEILSIIDDVTGNFVSDELAYFCRFVNDVKNNIGDQDIIDHSTNFLRSFSNNNSVLLNEWEEFLKEPPTFNELSPVEFWCNQCMYQQYLAKVALSVIQLPASTSSVERSFSIQKYIHNTYRNRLSHQHVKEEMIIAFNKKLEIDDNIFDIYNTSDNTNNINDENTVIDDIFDIDDSIMLCVCFEI